MPRKFLLVYINIIYIYRIVSDRVTCNTLNVPHFWSQFTQQNFFAKEIVTPKQIFNSA